MTKLHNIDIKIDLEQRNLNKLVEFRVSEIQTEIDLEMTGNELDLMNSRIVGDPITLIENALIPFDFVPV